jgi:hypothetical protein
MVEVSEDSMGGRMVREFHEAFGLPDPKMSKEETLELWERLIQEELKELKEAVEHTLKEMADVCYVLNGYALVGGDLKYAMKLEETAAKYVMRLLDWAVQYEAFRRVHESNMSKLGPDGKPMYREDGKVLKGPNYRPPDLSDLI